MAFRKYITMKKVKRAWVLKTIIKRTSLSPQQKAAIDQQLEMQLDITNNNLIGATNIGWIASRIMARAADKRAYPSIRMGEDEIRTWNTHVAQFETYDDAGVSDGPGDTYYFWTHVFAALIYSNKGMETEVMKQAFKNGTDVMMFVRKHIAHKPNITSHHPASSLGKEIGLALANLEE